MNDPRNKGRWYSYEDQISESEKFINAVKSSAGEPDFSGTVTSYEYTDGTYRNKQAGWFRLSDPDQNGKFLIGVHLLNDMSWMDMRKNSSILSGIDPRYNVLNPISLPVKGLMDQDLFGWGEDWRSWYNENFSSTAPPHAGILPYPIPDPNPDLEIKQYFYDPHASNMWGEPMVGYGKYWSAKLNLRLPSDFKINKVYKFYVNQENDPNDIGITKKAFNYRSASGSSIMSMANVPSMPSINSATNPNVVNIKNYGAIGDGLNDDTQAFVNAINAGPIAISVPSGN
jgi:hypothetical protein